VLHIAPTPFFSDRGCHIRIEGIASSLDELGYENLICTYHHGREVDGIHTSRISPIKNYTKTEAGPSKYKLWADIKLLCLVIKEIQKYKPMVIHAHLHEGLMIGLVAKALLFWKPIPLVADMQGSLFGELEAHGSFDKHRWLKWPIKAIEASLMFFAKTIVCSSAHSLEKIKSEFGLSNSKISLVQDGARIVSALTEDARSQLKQKFNLPEQKQIVVYSGALLSSKGLDELKQVIALSKELTSVHFLIVGYPVDELHNFLNQENLNERCTLTGQVAFETLPQLLQLADIAIDPKLSDAGEGSGKMLNYMACGLPVLAFDTQNNRTFLPEDTVLSNSVSEMGSHLQALLENEAFLVKSGAANLAYFKQHFSWEKSKLQLLEVYQRV
jgi:glycosyltransferase involved in cell wall biosynthesis